MQDKMNERKYGAHAMYTKQDRRRTLVADLYMPPLLVSFGAQEYSGFSRDKYFAHMDSSGLVEYNEERHSLITIQ